MSTPEQPPAPYRPSTTATLGAAGTSSVAAAHAAVTPTMVATSVQARAIAGAAEQIVEALGRFAQTRQTTIIPMLQSSLLETFVHRTPEEIAKLLGREMIRERQFLKRQASRIKRDLPKVLAEADVETRREKMAKLLSREKRYMAQREQAMTARAHSLVESLDVQDASPDGAYWQLGIVRSGHTPGCLAMAGKFWPWPVLREVIAPPVHPGCACKLLGLHEAVAKGLMKLGPLPSLKDAMLQARRNLSLEESILDELTEAEAIELADALVEGKQKRFPKGDAHGGEFMPSTGASFKRAKGAAKKLLTQRGEGRHVWIRGHKTWIGHDDDFRLLAGGKVYNSPPGGTNVYRESTLASVPGEAPLHADLEPPGGESAAPLVPKTDTPDLDAAAADRLAALTEQIAQRLQQPKAKPPISSGQDGKAAHEALLANGFVVRPAYSNAGKGELRMSYIAKSGHEIELQLSRKTGKVVEVRWRPDLTGGGLFDSEWKLFQAGKEPPGWGPPAKPYAKGSGSLGVPGGLFGGKAAGGHTGGKGGYTSSWKPPPPPPPTVHAALLDAPAETGLLPNYDHVELSQTHGSPTAKDPQGAKYALRAHDGDQDRVASELLANEVYRRLGATVPAAGVRHIVDDTPDFASIPDVDLGETPIEAKARQRISSGIIIRDAKGNVTIFEPKGHFGGYQHTFPKGGVERGLTPQQNAHKELWEETGLHARITGLVGDYQGDTSVSRYYTGVLTGGEPTPGDETESVKTVSPAEAAELLNKERDQQILADVLEHPMPKGKPPADAFPGPVGARAALAAPIVEDAKKERVSKPHAELAKHFMADALLGNWELLGKHGDEVIETADGKVLRHNHAAALGFRSDGTEKPFGPVPIEVWQLAGPRGPAFGRVAVTDAQKKRQAAAIAKALPPGVIDELVDAAPFRDDVMRNNLRNSLRSRVAWMDRYAKGDEAEPEPLSGDDAATELAAMQDGLELFPEQHAALDGFAEDAAAVNEHLQSGKPKEAATEQQREIISELDGLLRSEVLDEDLTAWLHVDPKDIPDGDLTGRTMNHRGYLQLALHPGKGDMRVTVPAGTRALYTRGIEGYEAPDAQPDVIGARGSRLRIVKHPKKGGIEAVVIP